MFSALVLALLTSVSFNQVSSSNAPQPTVAFVTYPATVKQPFVFTVQTHAQAQRVHAELWALNRSKEWVCINYDISHPERPDVVVSECGVLVPKGQSRTLRYTLTPFDIFFLRDRNCVVNQRVNVKIKVKPCVRRGLSFGESKEAHLVGF